MENILTVVAKVIEAAANFAAESASVIFIYQPEKPECLRRKDSDEE